jgi:hypothetical protein
MSSDALAPTIVQWSRRIVSRVMSGEWRICKGGQSAMAFAKQVTALEIVTKLLWLRTDYITSRITLVPRDLII